MEGESLVVLIILVMLGMLLIVLVLIIYINKAKSKVQNEQLQRQLLINAHRKDLLSYSIMGQEKERDRLSAELHDGIVSKLNIIHFKLSNLTSNATDQIQKEYININDLLQKTIEETRRISHDLFPVVLENFGLISALEELKELNRSNQIDTILTTSYSDKDFKIEEAIHIYRIVQELVNNAIKYAACSEIKISLNKDIEGFKLVFQDNGIGKKTDLEKGTGLGVKNIKSRLSMLNAKMTSVELNPGLQFIINQQEEEIA
jgi:signal transduction histidine kinase